ncbi:hypothetical protein V8E36_008018 [Tilletia maclaganii]
MRPAKARRLNGDTSWLFTLPFEQDGQERGLNVVLDPWLDESQQVDMTFAFSVQSRVVKAAAASLGEVDDLLGKEGEGSSGKVDILVLSHHFTDHAHPQTLVDPSNRPEIPLLGTPDALGPVRKLPGLPFRDVHAIPLATWDHVPSFAQDPVLPLPPGIRILRLAAKECFAFIRYGPAWPKLHGALTFIWRTTAEDTSAAPRFGALIYSPHGITDLPPWLFKAEPRILLHSLHRQTLPAWLAGPVALGYANALDHVNPARFIPTSCSARTTRTRRRAEWWRS